MTATLIVERLESPVPVEGLAGRLRHEPGLVLLQTCASEFPGGRYSFLAVDPFLRFRSWGSRCEMHREHEVTTLYGNPWSVLDSLLSRYELLDELDLPFPIGGCFGYWGYDLKQFVEPRLASRAVRDLDLPDCHVGFHDSLLVVDHLLGHSWIVASGLSPDGSRSRARAQAQRDRWRQRLDDAAKREPRPSSHATASHPATPSVTSNLDRNEFIRRIRRAQEYIRAGDIYQVNLSQRITVSLEDGGWAFYKRLAARSPAPFAAWIDGGSFQIASSSPEQFLRLSGSQIQTRPIKGTRPRSDDPTRDAQLSYELQSSTKERAELIMITDLLRNDLGRIAEYGSVQVPDLLRLERYSQVQHLVSTVEARLRPGVTHFQALASCFPGGSITGAPKIRAMQIIDELESVTRGPYTGCVGYLGFNRESQLSILIRAGTCLEGLCHFHVGAGIVADSIPEEEYEETWAKAGGLLAALNHREMLPALREIPSNAMDPGHQD